MDKNELKQELKNLKLQLILMQRSKEEKEKIEKRIEQVKKEYSEKVREEIEKERGIQK